MSELHQERSPLDGGSLVGRVLGDFAVLEKLAEGGFGTVYRAEQRALGREAVIKVLHQSLRGGSTQRFLREARLASTLDHPFAAHVYAFGAESDGLLWIAMELVKGTPLHLLLKSQGPMPLHRFVPFFEKLCEVVQTAHAQGITHRDLKPANVMVLVRAGKLLPKLLDLGIAKVRDLAAGGSQHLGAKESGTTHAPEMPSASTPQPERTFAPTQGDGATTSSSQSLVVTHERTMLHQAASLELTQAATMMGSPHYMAPEQWVDPAAADPRTDIYALGVLAYQCLTGELPFSGKSAREVAAAHARQALPPLPSELPSELQEVLAKAVAKRPADRHDSAMELALAVRGASKLTEEESVVPQISEDIRSLFINDAPQPLAEAMALLEAARRPQRAVATALGLLHVIARYIGVVALAARARVGPGEASDSEAVSGLLEKLRSDRLTDLEWWELAERLLQPFQDCKEAHPVPELVSLFSARSAEGDGLTRSFAELLRELDEAQRAVPHSDSLAQWVSRLGKLLKHFTFLHEYPLLLREGDEVQRWVGLRRSVRTTLATPVGAPDVDAFFLVGPDGATALTLFPLAQAIVPTPGAALEPFFLDGEGRHGARLVSLPIGFERHDERVWPWVSQRIAALEGGNSASAQEETPYLGLASFTSAQAQNFFGREREAEAFANRLRLQPLLSVVGPSGAGKSSFLQAGVLPLMPGWLAITARPGPSPFNALVQKLAQEGLLPEGMTPASARDALWSEPTCLREWLDAAARRLGTTVMLILDQFEELVTLCPAADERNRFAEALVRAANAADRPVRIVLAFRDDFLIRLQQIPAMRERIGAGLQLLGTPAEDDLLRILLKPAERARYGFEDDELPREMVKEVVALPGALALLSFTASKLWELRDRERKLLTRKAYLALGGVGGALAHHAEATLASMPSGDQPLVRETFRHLVTAEGTRAVLSRRELDELLGGAAISGPLLERLIVARLLVTSESGAAEDRVEVIHEALLASWPRLVQWQREDAETLRIRDALRAAARQWSERGKPRGLLWRGEPLLEYRVWRARYTGAMTELEAAFAGASLREEARGRNIRRGLLAGSFAALLVVLAIVSRAQRHATRSAAEAKARLAELREEQGRLSVLDGKPLEAITFLDSAYREGIRGRRIRFLAGRGVEATAAVEFSAVAHEGVVTSISVTPDDSYVLSAGGDRRAALWSTASGQRVAELVGHHQAILATAFTPDGKLALTGAMDGTVRLWNVPEGTPSGVLDVGPPGAAGIDVSPDGRWAAMVHFDQRVSVWDLRARTLVASLQAPTRLSQVRFSPDGRYLTGWVGRYIFDSGEPGKVALWERTRETWIPRLLEGHAAAVRGLAFSPDRKTIATGSDDGSLRIWNLETRRTLHLLNGHSSPIIALAYSPDGRSLVSGSADTTARVWDAEQGKSVAVLAGHSGPIQYVAFTPDGARVLTGSDDRSVRSWDRRGGAYRWLFAGHVEPITGLLPMQREASIITSGAEGFVKRWRLDRQRMTAFPTGDHFMQIEVASSADRLLALRMDQKTFEEWDVHERRSISLRELGSHVEYFGWSPPADLLVTTNGREVQGWRFSRGEALWTLPSLEKEAPQGTVIALSPDGTRLAFGHVSRAEVELWETGARRRIALLSVGREPNIAMGFSPDSRELLLGSAEGTMSRWRASDGHQEQTLRTGRGAAVTALAESPDGRLVAAGFQDRTIAVWATNSDRQVAKLQGRQGGPQSISFSPDSSLVVSVGYSPFYSIWETEQWKRVEDGSMTTGQTQVFFASPSELLSVQWGAGITAWDVSANDLGAEAFSEFVRCKIPYRLEGEQLVASLRPGAGCR